MINNENAIIYKQVYDLLINKINIVIFDMPNVLSKLGTTIDGLCSDIAYHFVYKKYITGKYDKKKSDIQTYLLGKKSMVRSYVLDKIRDSYKLSLSHSINLDSDNLINQESNDTDDNFSEKLLEKLNKENILTEKEKKLFYELFIYTEKSRKQINDIKRTKKFEILINKIKEYAERQKNR